MDPRSASTRGFTLPTTLIVLAHPERRSFNGAWAEASATAASELGHKVLFSDLVGMGFDAVERREHYSGQSGSFDPLMAQETSENNGIPAGVAGEIAKIEAADLIIFHFPIWWFAPPAILKGWLDRTLIHGRMHTVDQRFDRGKFRGKRALFCVSTGATRAECGLDGREGDLDLLLWPLAQTLRYLGFDVLSPLKAHGVHGYHTGAAKSELESRLSSILADQKTVLASVNDRATIDFNADTDFDTDGRLKPTAPVFSPFIRH